MMACIERMVHRFMTIFLDDSFLNGLHRIMGRERFAHSCGVATIARDLAPVWGVARDKAHYAGLLHDYARSLAEPELLSLAQKYAYHVDTLEQMHPILLHGAVGAFLVQESGLSDDCEILTAIRQHVTGDCGMTRLDQLVFVADMIEPGRCYDGVENLRDLAAANPRQALISALKLKMAYLEQSGAGVHPRTIAALRCALADCSGPGSGSGSGS